MNKEKLLSSYALNLAGSKYRNHYLKYAKDFLDNTKDLGKEAVDTYIEKLQEQKQSAGTVNFAFRVVRRLYTVNKLDWPYLRGQAPQITERDEHRPALAFEIISTMIKSENLHDDERCFLALSTTYGLRREEMMELEPQDIDFKSGTIFISTVKSGRQRYHLIPEQIKPFLSKHDFAERYSKMRMSQMFWRVVNNSGLGALKSETLGWHSIRRPLLSGLVDNGLNVFAAKAFLRWKASVGELAMPARYYSNVVVTLQGSLVVSEEAKEDKEVFEKFHPFLPLWDDNEG